MRATPIDLSQLPPPEIIETLDYETLLAERKARLVSLYPEGERAEIAATLELESEPLVRLLQENAYRELLLRQIINDKARAVLLAYARGKTQEAAGRRSDRPQRGDRAVRSSRDATLLSGTRSRCGS